MNTWRCFMRQCLKGFKQYHRVGTMPYTTSQERSLDIPSYGLAYGALSVRAPGVTLEKYICQKKTWCSADVFVLKFHSINAYKRYARSKCYIHNRYRPCPTNDNINSKGSFSELLFSFVLEKYTICDICSMKSPAFETTSLLYVTPNDSSSMQELLMQEHKQKIYKTCFCCGRDTWHIESKQILQPPNYLIIIVNRITYSNNRITKNKSRMPLDLYIKLGPYKFSLQASVDHHGYSMNSGHYTASINCCGKTFHCNDNKITECNITDTYNSSTAYILLYKLMLC